MHAYILGIGYKQVKSNCRKLEKKVGMAMPKSIQTRVVGMITMTCLLNDHDVLA